MKNLVKIIVLVCIISVSILFSCKQSENNETILKGTTTILVDETLKPIIEDQIAVFESKYDAKITMDAKSETETVLALLKDTASIAVLSRTLDKDELRIFENKKIKPRITKFATDAIAFISNSRSKDTLIDLEEVVLFLKGKNSKFKGLVFDNLNSSTVRYMFKLAGINQVPSTGVFSFKTNEEVIKFVAENEGMIGVVGLNWLYQPTPSNSNYVKKVVVMSVKAIGKSSYFAPTQNNMAEGTYPLARDLYIVNCQGYSGLGMGFASFIAGDIGQRIILKSGLLPVSVPTRNIIIRKEIEKKILNKQQNE